MYCVHIISSQGRGEGEERTYKRAGRSGAKRRQIEKSMLDIRELFSLP